MTFYLVTWVNFILIKEHNWDTLGYYSSKLVFLIKPEDPAVTPYHKITNLTFYLTFYHVDLQSFTEKYRYLLWWLIWITKHINYWNIFKFNWGTTLSCKHFFFQVLCSCFCVLVCCSKYLFIYIYFKGIFMSDILIISFDSLLVLPVTGYPKFVFKLLILYIV